MSPVLLRAGAAQRDVTPYDRPASLAWYAGRNELSLGH